MPHLASQFDLKFDRISMTLRRGGAVMIRDGKGQAGLVRAAEFSDIAPERFEDIAISSETLWCTILKFTEWMKSMRADKLCMGSSTLFWMK